MASLGEIHLSNHDGVWECPDLVRFEVDGQELWVLIVSVNPGAPNGGSGTQYFIGNFSIADNNVDFSNYPWTANHWMDWGPDNYAGVTFSNEPHGRNIYMGWMTNWMYAGATPNLSHRGQMTIPRQLGIRSFGNNNFRLTSNPVPELENLRDPEQHLVKPEEFQVPPQTVIELTAFANFTTPLMELEINLELTNNPQFSICAYNNMDEEVCVGCNNTEWYLDRSKSGNVGFSDYFRNALVATAPREISEGKTNIRIFLDVSSIEVFVDDGLTTFTALHFPSEPFNKFYLNHWSDPNGLAIVDVKGFSIWGLKCWFESD